MNELYTWCIAGTKEAECVMEGDADREQIGVSPTYPAGDRLTQFSFRYDHYIVQ